MMRRAAHSCSARRSAQVPSRAQPSCPTRSRKRMSRLPQEQAPPIRMRAARGSAHSSTAKTPPPSQHLRNGSCPAHRASRPRGTRTYPTTSTGRLAGAYAVLLYFYRRGLASLDAYCHKAYKEPFRRLSAAQQDEVIAALEQGKASEFSWPSAAAFFNTVRTHTMEGMFADPIYGGNKDFAGWRLVGFPGGQLEFTAADMQSSGPFTRLPIVGLQAKAG